MTPKASPEPNLEHQKGETHSHWSEPQNKPGVTAMAIVALGY